MKKTIGYAALSASSRLEPFAFELREVGPHDVHIEILYCGVCHSDIHEARNEWKESKYPLVPGHEIIGKVITIGDKVSLFTVNEIVAVGAYVDSCGACEACKKKEENYCPDLVETFNSFDKHTGGVTYGGFSKEMVVNEYFLIPIPNVLKEGNLAALAPLIDAGVTVYSPLRHWNVGPSKTVGIVGIGGLGHLALKMARALGAHVIALTSSEDKIKDMARLGADETILTSNQDQMKKHQDSLDLIINTVSVRHDLKPFIELLKRDGTMVMVGMPAEPHSALNAKELVMKRRSIAGSLIGSIQEMKDMFEFCAKHAITTDVEIIPIEKINEAFEDIISKKVRYRYVIDLSTLRENEPASTIKLF